jgi:hypothetical protein
MVQITAVKQWLSSRTLLQQQCRASFTHLLEKLYDSSKSWDVTMNIAFSPNVKMCLIIGTTPWRRRGNGRTAPYRGLLTLSTRWRWLVSFTPEPLYPPVKEFCYPLNKLGGPQMWHRPRESNPPAVQSVVQLSFFFSLVLRPLFWPIVPAPDDRWWWWWWSNWWNKNWQGKRKYSEETCPSATLSTTNPPWPEPGSNPGRHVGKPATYRRSYGTACSPITVRAELSRVEQSRNGLGQETIPNCSTATLDLCFSFSCHVMDLLLRTHVVFFSAVLQ